MKNGANMLGTTWRTFSDHVTYFQSSDVQVSWSSHHLFRQLVLFSEIRCLTMAALPWMLHLFASRRAVFVKTESSRWILSSAVTFALVVVLFLTQSSSMYGDTFHLVLVFGHYSSQMMTSSHDLCTPSTMTTAAVDTLNKVAVLVKDAPAKRAPTNCPLWKSDNLQFCSTFHANPYWTKSVILWHWHYTA